MNGIIPHLWLERHTAGGCGRSTSRSRCRRGGYRFLCGVSVWSGWWWELGSDPKSLKAEYFDPDNCPDDKSTAGRKHRDYDAWRISDTDGYLVTEFIARE